MRFTLTFLAHHDILDECEIDGDDAKLEEPSGLVLSPDGNGLWTVSDDSAFIFRLALDGGLRPAQSFRAPSSGLEGVTIEPQGRFLFAVREGPNEIIKFDLDTREPVERHDLEDIPGFDRIRADFEDSGRNKGLEGIAWNAHRNSLFALKEGDPGLLIEVAADLSSILADTRLDADNGFTDPGTKSKKIDFSGICYDPGRKAFWIVSDKARRVFLYDLGRNQVLHSAPLGYSHNGGYREVKKAEGVAYDPDLGRLYVVSDEEVRLYVYDVRD